jgi:hypothetical protein
MARPFDRWLNMLNFLVIYEVLNPVHKYIIHPRCSTDIIPSHCILLTSLSEDLYVKIQIFWNVTPCRLVNSYRRFGGAQCLRLHDIGLLDPSRRRSPLLSR